MGYETSPPVFHLKCTCFAFAIYTAVLLHMGGDVQYLMYMCTLPLEECACERLEGDKHT